MDGVHPRRKLVGLVSRHAVCSRGFPKVTRGEVWWAELAGDAGFRPVVMVSRSDALDRRQNLTIAEVTRVVRSLPCELPLSRDDGLPTDCVINTDNLHTVPTNRLRQHSTTLSQERLLVWGMPSVIPSISTGSPHIKKHPNLITRDGVDVLPGTPETGDAQTQPINGTLHLTTATPRDGGGSESENHTCRAPGAGTSESCRARSLRRRRAAAEGRAYSPHRFGRPESYTGR